MTTSIDEHVYSEEMKNHKEAITEVLPRHYAKEDFKEALSRGMASWTAVLLP